MKLMETQNLLYYFENWMMRKKWLESKYKLLCIKDKTILEHNAKTWVQWNHIHI